MWEREDSSTTQQLLVKKKNEEEKTCNVPMLKKNYKTLLKYGV